MRGSLLSDFWVEKIEKLQNDPPLQLSTEVEVLRIKYSDLTVILRNLSPGLCYKKCLSCVLKSILGFKTCHDVYISGITDNGFYNIQSDDGRTVVKECIFDKPDCKAWKDSGHTTTGVYEIFIPEIGHKMVKCGMTFESGGWIIFQNR